MRIMVAVVSLLLSVAAADARYCNNPNCRMCNRLFGPMNAATTFVPPVSYSPPTVSYSPPAVSYSPAPPPIASAESDLEIDSTPRAIVPSLLMVAKPAYNECLYDIGCGDGRILIEAAKRYRCKSIGIEIDRDRAILARNNANKSGHSQLIEIVRGDARDQDLSQADVVVVYLFPDLIADILPKLEPGTRIVSYSHRIPGVQNQAWSVTHEGAKHTFYLHVVGGSEPPLRLTD